MSKIDRYTNIRAAALLIARDNGMINRFHSEEEFLGTTEFVLTADGVDDADLVDIDYFLGFITPEQLDTLCCGEQTEARAVSALFPDQDKLKGLLNDIFEGYA